MIPSNSNPTPNHSSNSRPHSQSHSHSHTQNPNFVFVRQGSHRSMGYMVPLAQANPSREQILSADPASASTPIPTPARSRPSLAPSPATATATQHHRLAPSTAPPANPSVLAGGSATNPRLAEFFELIKGEFDAASQDGNVWKQQRDDYEQKSGYHSSCFLIEGESTDAKSNRRSTSWD